MKEPMPGLYVREDGRATGVLCGYAWRDVFDPASRFDTGPAARPLPLKLVRDIQLPGGPSRFDYQWVDSASGRLYIAHLGADSIAVFDLRAGRVIGVIDGLPNVHGVVAVPERHLVFATVTVLIRPEA